MYGLSVWAVSSDCGFVGCCGVVVAGIAGLLVVWD